MKSIALFLFSSLLYFLPICSHDEILPDGYELADLFEGIEENEEIEEYKERAWATPPPSRIRVPMRECSISWHKTSRRGIQRETPPPALAILEAGPSAMVAGCVHALSGSFFDADTDMIIPGAVPLVVNHSYNASQKEWHFHHMPELEVGQSNGAHHLYAAYHDGSGAAMVYTARHSESKRAHRMDIPNDVFQKGATNCSSGYISGQTNWKNSALLYSHLFGEKRYIVTHGSAVNRVFTRYKRYGKQHQREALQGKFHLQQEHYPNGNHLDYTYDNNDKLISVQAFSKQGTLLGKLDVKQAGAIREWSCNGASVRYCFDIKGKELRSIAPSMGRYATFEYEDGHITRKQLPEGRFQKIEYTRDQGETKVLRLLAPVGHDQAAVVTHTFGYIGNKRQGATNVADAVGNVTQYLHENQRLKSIIHYAGTRVYSCETFHWGSGANEGNLRTRVYGSDRELCFCRQFEYDKFGNVTKNTLWGNLTGENALPPIVDSAGTILPNGCDKWVKINVYSQDKRNLLLEEHEGDLSIYYAYDPATHLLQSRLTKSQGRILKREFFSHDANGVVIEELTDDGTSTDRHDLTGVTERHYKRITPTSTMPIGLPAIVEEGYVDHGRYISLRKEVNTYSPQGKLIEQAHYDRDGALAYTLRWCYNKLGLITEQTNALGEVTRFEYDGNGNKIRESTDAVEHLYTYDYANRLIREDEVWPDGQRFRTTHRYNILSQRIETIDPVGHSTTFAYDLLGRLIETHLPPIYAADGTLTSSVIKNEYDLMGNVVATWDANGCCTRTQYTIRGEPCHIEHPDGSQERIAYTLTGWVKKKTERNGITTRYTHDPLGRVIRTEVCDREGNPLKSTSATYNTFHLLNETDEAGVVTHYTYDKAGRCIQQSTEDRITTYQYNALGKKTHTAYAGRVNVQLFDLLDRVVEERIEDEAGQVLHRETYQYDIQGNRTHTTVYGQAGAATTVTLFNPHGDPITVTDALGHVTHYTYDYHWIERGQQVLRVIRTDPLGNRLVTTYDTQGHVSSQERQNAFGNTLQLETYVYDPIGQRLSTLTHHPRSILTQWEYDLMGQVTQLTEAVGLPEQKTTRWIYNGYGQKEKMITPKGIELQHSYDSLGRLACLRSSDHTIHYVYTYDIKDRPTIITDEINQTKNCHAYDLFGNLLSETLDNGLTLQYSYDAQNRRTLLTLPDSSAVRYQYDTLHLTAIERLKDGKVHYAHRYTAYDQAGNILSEKMLGKAGTIDFKYDQLQRTVGVHAPQWKETIPTDGYDAAGNLVKRQVSDQQGTIAYAYSYDSLYQIMEESGIAPHAYQHDPLHNRMEKDGTAYQHNHLNQLLSHGDTQYEYDGNGNLISRSIGSNKMTFRYDALDRLIEVSNGETSTQYRYDAFHRRIAKQQGDCTIAYLYEKQNEIGAVQNGTITELRLLGVGLGAEIGAAVAIELKGSHYVPIHDPYGNVVSLVDPEGAVAESYRYTAFGEIEAPSTLSNPWLYSSKRFDPETGYLYFGRRYYAPDIGRWITPDPAGLVDTMNLYAYVRNNTFRYTDPDGQMPAAIVFVLPFLGGSFALGEGITIGLCIEAALGTITGALLGWGVYEGIKHVDSVMEESEQDTSSEPQTTSGKEKTDSGNVEVPPHNGSKLGANPTKCPGEGFKWRGKGPPESGRGSWIKEVEGELIESLHPDVNHPPPKKPHWDYISPSKTHYRLNLDGTWELK